MHMGGVRYHGGSADICDGEYQERTVAIKRLRMNGSPDGTFKVYLINLT